MLVISSRTHSVRVRGTTKMEILASYDDINVHLPGNLKCDNTTAGIAAVELDVVRVVRGYLAGTFSASILYGWDAPATTPDIIRGVAGRLAAALLYSRTMAQGVPDNHGFSQAKYNEGMRMLGEIRAGKILVYDIDETQIGGSTFSNADFYPNAAAGDPKFSMDSEF